MKSTRIISASFNVTLRMFPDLNEYYETDKQFHQMFIDATSNDYLISTYERIAQQNTRLRIYSGRKSRNRLLASQQEHLKIVEYCLKQDWALASKAMEEHLYHSKKLLSRLLFTQIL